MAVSKVILHSLYEEACEKVTEYEHTRLYAHNFTKMLIQNELLWYWKGRRDAYYLMLKGVKE